MKITKEESVAEELIKLIKAEYINMNNEFQSTKFRIDHPKLYNKIAYHFPSDSKFTSMEKLRNELACSGTSKALLDMTKYESKGIGDLLFYCDLKRCFEQGMSLNDVANQLSVSKQYVSKKYKKLKNRFGSENIGE